MPHNINKLNMLICSLFVLLVLPDLSQAQQILEKVYVESENGLHLLRREVDPNGRSYYVLSMGEGQADLKGDKLTEFLDNSLRVYDYGKDELNYKDGALWLIDVVSSGGIPAMSFLEGVTVYAYSMFEQYQKPLLNWTKDGPFEWSAWTPIIGEELGVNAYVRFQYWKHWITGYTAQQGGEWVLTLNVQRSNNMKGNYLDLFVFVDGRVRGGHRFKLKKGKIRTNQELITIKLNRDQLEFVSNDINFIGFLVDKQDWLERKLKYPGVIGVFSNKIFAGHDMNKDITLKKRIKKSSLVILDTSGSMGNSGKTAGSSKLDEAKSAISSVLASFVTEKTSSQEWALMVYNGCTRTPIIQDFTQKPELVLESLQQITARFKTPLARSIEEGAAYIRQNGVGNAGRIIVLTDGGESCRGNPVDAANQVFQMNRAIPMSYNFLLPNAAQAGQNPSTINTMPIQIDIIGFTVDPASQVAELLRQVATAGGGQYYTAANTQQLIAALKITFGYDTSNWMVVPVFFFLMICFAGMVVGLYFVATRLRTG